MEDHLTNRNFPGEEAEESSGGYVGEPSAFGQKREIGPRYRTHILQSLRRIIRAVDLYSRKLATNYSITGPQLVCLEAIVDLGPVTATRIAREIHLSASTVVGILARLEEKGLILRHRSERDRRQIHVMPSETGRRLIENAPSPLQDTLTKALGGLSDLEQATIALSLSRIVELMEASDFDESTILDTSERYDEEAAAPEDSERIKDHDPPY